MHPSPFISVRRRRRLGPRGAWLGLLLAVLLGSGWMLNRSGAAAAMLDPAARSARVVDPAERPAPGGGGRPGGDLAAPHLLPPASFTPISGAPRLEPPASAARRTRAVLRGTGVLRTARGRSGASNSGPVQLYGVEVEGGLGVPRERFATAVEATFADERGWGSPGLRAFRRTDGGSVAFRVTLASPATTDRLCAPLSTRGTYSCFQGGRAVLNARRWVEGAVGYRGRLGDYRRYMINHEVGHALGLGHSGCPRRGARAPVMLQQTKGLGGCRPGPWPLASERGTGG